MKIQATPLHVWGWVGSFFVILQIVVVLFFYKSEMILESDKLYFDQINYIQKEFKRNKSSYKTIIIGNSLVGQGVACLNEFSYKLNSKTNTDIKLLKIWDVSDPLERFVQLNLINEIIQAKPDLVLFQKDLLTLNNSKEKHYINYLMQKLSVINRSVVKNIFFNKTYNLKDICYLKGYTRLMLSDTLNLIPEKREVRAVDDFDFVFQGLALLQKEGIKIILVDVPRNVQSDKAIYTNTVIQQEQELFKTYNENFGIEHWSYTGSPLYYRHCSDDAHLNREGRSIYTNWLLDKIEKEM